MRRVVWGLAALLLASRPAGAQGLREKISELFVFTPGQQPLFLGGTGVHANHFITSASSQNGILISFLGNAIGTNVAGIPVSATSGGSTFRFEVGAPVRTSVSPGPVFAERAQTLGRGRVFVGANINRLHFTTLRGIGLDDIRLNSALDCSTAWTSVWRSRSSPHPSSARATRRSFPSPILSPRISSAARPPIPF
ncbi:MAG: hypothetical protein AUG85_01655 [Gemmatimonadetes bacterium 13_1_20CM_4_66_11]|nr:MAG: hypothetical protein AUG85_01655 [Gemmatimonadetes bacterium 13_1_20CM_4_66_11]